MATTWQSLYANPLVGTWLLAAVAAAGVALVTGRGGTSGGVEPRAAGFVRIWALVFGLDALFDPIATGILGWPMLPFVLLGDYRVFALVLVLLQPGRARAAVLVEAAAWTLLVPVVAYGGYHLLGGPPPETILWLIYEIAFVLLTVMLLAVLVPARVGAGREAVRRYLQTIAAVVISYYGLWAVADVLILTGRDDGWALRIVPNLLYYGVFVPYASLQFHAASRSAAASTSVQAAR